ncbi:MAG: hypothetical protein U0559_01715 [Anaerolineae bacterium]
MGHSLPNACAPTIDYLQIIDGDQWVQECTAMRWCKKNYFIITPVRACLYCTDGHYLMELNDAGWRQWWSTQVTRSPINNEDDALFADSFSVPNYFR